MIKWINKKRNQKGFTLVELVVVIAILGILAAIAIPKFSKFTKTAEEQADKVSASTIKNAFALERANKTFSNEADVKVTITPKNATTKITSSDVKVSAESGGLNATLAGSIVTGAIEDLYLKSGKKIEILIKGNDGEISSKLVD